MQRRLAGAARAARLARLLGATRATAARVAVRFAFTGSSGSYRIDPYRLNGCVWLPYTGR